ncbi:hypothetical protein VTI74DRAFT_10864 [Chaetomium olivicolor]
MLVMTFLAYRGETFHPCFLRLVIWIMHKVVPKESSARRRFASCWATRGVVSAALCCSSLFPSRPTWLLAGILFPLNFIDVLLIIILNLDNPTVNDLPMGPRILAALFQTASSRHTGTTTLSLAQVNTALQFSLIVMMYIVISPTAISILLSNPCEERALGMYEHEVIPDESNGKSYVMMHIRNQLSFDLWYIFLGPFFICVPESARIADVNEPVSDPDDKPSGLASGSRGANSGQSVLLRLLGHVRGRFGVRCAPNSWITRHGQADESAAPTSVSPPWPSQRHDLAVRAVRYLQQDRHLYHDDPKPSPRAAVRRWPGCHPTRRP